MSCPIGCFVANIFKSSHFLFNRVFLGEYDNTNLGTVHLDLQEESKEESMDNYEEIDDDDKVGPFILHNQYSIL